jgi:hypothetical protein
MTINMSIPFLGLPNPQFFINKKKEIFEDSEGAGRRVSKALERGYD